MALSGGDARIDDREFQRLFRAMDRKLKDLREFFHDEIDPTVTDFFEQQFETRGDFGGSPWEPIRPLTQQLRERAGHGRGGSSAILWDTGGMRRDFLNATGTGFRRVERKEYSRGAVSEVAALHQTGWTATTIFGQPRRKPVKVPARPVVPDDMPRTLIDQWCSKMTAWLERLI